MNMIKRISKVSLAEGINKTSLFSPVSPFALIKSSSVEPGKFLTKVFCLPALMQKFSTSAPTVAARVAHSS